MVASWCPARADIFPLEFVPDPREGLVHVGGEIGRGVRDHIDGCLGDASDQEYFVVAEQYAFGPP